MRELIRALDTTQSVFVPQAGWGVGLCTLVCGRSCNCIYCSTGSILKVLRDAGETVRGNNPGGGRGSPTGGKSRGLNSSSSPFLPPSPSSGSFRARGGENGPHPPPT